MSLLDGYIEEPIQKDKRKNNTSANNISGRLCDKSQVNKGIYLSNF